MNPASLIVSLRTFPESLRALVGHLDAEHARRRGPGGAWSIVEIVHHLADEETEDFRSRLRSTLDDPHAPWTPIDPEGAVRERDAAAADLAEQLERFTDARAESIIWLESLVPQVTRRAANGAADAASGAEPATNRSAGPDWSRTHAHPALGPIAAGDLLASWADHDLLHLRQIARRLHEIIQAEAAPFGTDYAGEIGQ